MTQQGSSGWTSGPGTPRPGSSRLIWGFAAGFVLLLIGAVAVVRMSGGADDPAGDGAAPGESAAVRLAHRRAPFEEAVLALAQAPGAHYDDGVFSVQLTLFGDYTGSVEARGGVYPVIRTDGVTSVQLPASSVNALQPSATETTATWVKAGPATAEYLGVSFGDVPDDPSDLAQRVLDDLNDPATDFTAADSTTTPTASTNGDDEGMLTVTTPSGPVRVSASSPHRLMSVPVLSAGSGTDDTADTDSTAGGAADPVSFARPAAASATATPVQLTAAQVDEAFEQIVKRARTTAKTVDPGVVLDLEQQAAINCTEYSCSVSARITAGARTAGSDSEVTSGTVRASLTADIEVDGKTGAGKCTAVTTMKLDKSKTLKCTTTSAGPELRSALSRAKAQAEAKSRAMNGARVPYTVPYGGTVDVRAVARVNVKTLVRLMLSRQDLLDDLLEQAEPQTEPQAEPEGQTGTQPGNGTQPGTTTAPGTTGGAEPAPQPSGSGVVVPQPDPDDEDPVGCADLEPAGATPHGTTGWKNFVIRPTGGSDQGAAGGRTEVGEACFEKPVVSGHPTAPTGNPAGWLDGQKTGAAAFPSASGNGLARCHLVPAVLGGPNEASTGNLVTCWQAGININSTAKSRPVMKVSMRDFEKHANAWIRSSGAANTVTVYEVTPVYRSAKSTIPTHFSMRFRSWDRDTHQLKRIRWISVPNVTLDEKGKTQSLAN
ncbi:hypothetical protein KIH74_22130 [Kineosporia sp. J2-2]|uniref:DNA/RNA non-specific endonuclease n=1 Tax=Kineosporia corallincola TaxID=2835133 RepID=A0ABS5TPX9_9ACTN|nr:hypothetical protein [Kineosporia corallincola]MBT0771654.1 hypothetical protein [Kineosporia corallincola]